MNIRKINIDLSVRNKLYVSFIAVSMLAVLIGGIGYTQLQSVDAELETTSSLFEIRESGTAATKALFEMALSVDAYVGSGNGDPAYRADIDEHWADAGGYVAKNHELIRILGDQEYDDVTTQTDVSVLDWVTKVNVLLEAYDEAKAEHGGDIVAIQTAVADEYEAHEKGFDHFTTQVVSFEQYAIEKVNASKEKADGMVTSATMMIVVAAGVSVVSAIILGVIISRSIANPLGQLVSDANIVAQGNLGHEFEVKDRDDEIGEVITSIKGMVQNTANLVGSVQNAADTVVSMSQGLSSTAQQANASMQQVSSATQQIAQGAAQLSSLSQESSQNANRLSAVLQQTGANSEKAGESIQQIMTAMETTTSTVENMDKSLEEIGNLANIVTDVANQTQLLALNAAIEAARAGEAGRGFAVVADAVRELSEQTNQAAVDTLKSVGDVQKNGKDAIQVAQGSTEEASEGVEVVNETIAGVSQGVGAVEAVVKAIDEMASIAEEAAASAEENTAATEEQTAAMNQLSENASNLEEIATQLQAEMAKFQL